jgi:D-alanyl-D-alanine-carboxypeptidase/D-alanyl-D-alanine-endopeptidase
VDGDNTEVVVFGALDDGRPPDGGTVFEIGSVTKTFTATLLARAVLAGRVTLDTPVAQLLPDFRIPSRGGKEVTLGELGSQYSGLPRLPSNFFPQDPANPYADYDPAKLKAFLAEYQLPRDPGASYEYSNLGFGLLGHALAQLDRTTYGALADDAILRPLGMTMSGTAFTDAMRAHLAPGHDETGTAAKNWDFDALAGAGAIRSTANDMLRYLKANMGSAPSPLAAAMKLAQRPRRDMAGSTRIGLAWMTTDKGIVWHNGQTAGYRSFIGFTADGRKGVVMLADAAVAPNEFFARIAAISISFTRDSAGAVTGLVLHQNGDRAAPKLSASALPPAPKEIDVDPAALGDYVGQYRFSFGVLDVALKRDHLEAQLTGQPAFPIFASAKDKFFYKVVDAQLDFERDAGGRVLAVVLHQNGRDMRAPRTTGPR